MPAGTITFQPQWLDSVDSWIGADVSDTRVELIPFIPSPYHNDAPLLAVPDDFAASRLPRAFTRNPSKLLELAHFHGELLIPKISKSLRDGPAERESDWWHRLEKTISLASINQVFRGAIPADILDPSKSLAARMDGVITWIIDRARSPNSQVALISTRLAANVGHPTVEAYLTKQALQPFLPSSTPMLPAMLTIKGLNGPLPDPAEKRDLIESIHGRLAEISQALVDQVDEYGSESITMGAWTERELFIFSRAVEDFAEERPMTEQRRAELAQPGSGGIRLARGIWEAGARRGLRPGGGKAT